MPSPFEIFMMSQVHEWMAQQAIDPDLEVPNSVLQFYFRYKARQLFRGIDPEVLER